MIFLKYIFWLDSDNNKKWSELILKLKFPTNSNYPTLFLKNPSNILFFEYSSDVSPNSAVSTPCNWTPDPQRHNPGRKHSSRPAAEAIIIQTPNLKTLLFWNLNQKT